MIALYLAGAGWFGFALAAAAWLAISAALAVLIGKAIALGNNHPKKKEDQ